MKELNFEKSLTDEIKSSKKRYNLKGKLYSLLRIMISLAAMGLLSYFVISNGLILSAIIGFGLAGALYTGHYINKSHKIKKESFEATNHLRVLEEELKHEGLDVNLKNLQKSVITENKIKTENIDRKGKLSVTEEIIKHFYMLDEEEQVKVLRETLKSCKLPDGSYTEIKKLFLLEEEDLKTLEMPDVIKALKFNDTKK